MQYLTDTHVLLWAFLERKKLSRKVLDILSDEENEIYYSPLNIWEISIKYCNGKLELNGILPEEFYAAVENDNYICLPLDNYVVSTVYQLPLRHKDPFDRLLIWAALRNDLTFLTVDRTAARYAKDGLRCVW